MDLKELYRDVILDHNRHPRNFGRIEPADSRADGHNPLCGDRLSVFVVMNGTRVEDIRCEARGCANSTASASLMTEAVKGKDRAAIRELFEEVHRLLTRHDEVPAASLGKLADRKSTRLNSSHVSISYAAFCSKKKTGARLTFNAVAHALQYLWIGRARTIV